MKDQPLDGPERLIWIEPIVESLDVRATESNWGGVANDGSPGGDSASS